jgi:hypothetical protein
MARLDPEKSRKAVAMGPSTEEIQERISSTQEVEEIEQGPIQTAASYSRRVQVRKAQTARLKKGGKPLGGAQPLDPEKMESLANSMMPRPNFGVEESPPDQQPQARQPVEPPPQMKGVGSAYQVNQKMAQGELDRPVSLKEAKKMEPDKTPTKKPLSDETVRGLSAAQQEAEKETPKKSEVKEDDTQEELDRASEEMVGRNPDLFNFGAISQAVRDMQSGKRREAIEANLAPMDITDLITKQEIEQEIPVIPRRLSYTLRTISQAENLFCLQYLYDHPGSGLYVEEFLTTCKLTCSVVEINGARLPDHRKGVGTAAEEIDKEEFEKKLKILAKMPVHLIADISIQAIWFNDRVNKLFDVGALKNG